MNKNVTISVYTFLFFILLGTIILSPAASVTYAQNPEYLDFADQMPEPEGGLEGIIKKVKYPAVAKNAGIEGRVFLQAYVNEKGGVDDVKIVKSLGGGCDEAAIDAVKDTKFSVGKSKGVAVKVKVSLAITFKL